MPSRAAQPGPAPSALEQLRAQVDRVVAPALEDWKRQGKPVVGFLCSHVPEELLSAARVWPIRLRAPDCTETTEADTHLSRLNCTFVRSCLQFILTDRYDVLDGLICTNTCDHARRLYDVVRQTGRLKFVHLLSVPHKVGGQSTTRWFAGELARLGDRLADAFGVAVSEAALRESMRAYDETRGLLHQLYELRKANAPPLSGAEALTVVTARASMHPTEYHRLLTQLLDELSNRSVPFDQRARLMVAGSGGCDQPAFFEHIEQAGGLIVADTLCTGSRSFWRLAEPEDDVWLSLARCYLERPGCAHMTDRVADRVAFVRQMAEDYAVDGVVFQRLRYCDLWGGQLLILRRALSDAGIPLLSLEREYALGATGQLATRVQAFVESIEGQFDARA